MFTGIVQALITITAVERAEVTRVTFTQPGWGALTLGESVLVHGICSTVTSQTTDTFTVEYMPETLTKTNVADWRVGQSVHAEPSLTLQTKLSGNLVYGHVDATAIIQTVTQQDGQTEIVIELPKELLPFALVKGALTINGINLTIVSVNGNTVTVDLIPHTANVTTLARQQVGDRVNIEADYLTKVIVQTAQQRLG